MCGCSVRVRGRHRLNDGRAYDVGLSDDAGGANPLGFATSQAFAPTQDAVDRIDEYIRWTLYGIKNDTAKPPFKSLQLPEPNNGIRMTLFCTCMSEETDTSTAAAVSACCCLPDNWPCALSGVFTQTTTSRTSPGTTRRQMNVALKVD
jgi:hypothetical protein